MLFSFNTFSQSSKWEKEYFADDDSFLTLGMESFNLKMNFEAIQYLNKSIEINDKNFMSYFFRGLAKTRIEDVRGSIMDLVKAEEILNFDKENNGRYSNNYKEYLSHIYEIRGIGHIQLNKKDVGCLLLSKSGELGNKSAYDVIKQLCN
jgi:tetratricopeptide (TPR) repeat protein